MRALIYELPHALGVGALDIAGRPLVLRQLQWLRELGIEDVVVELASHPSAAPRAELLLGSDPLCRGVMVLPSRAPLGVEQLAARVGLLPESLFLALPASLLVAGRCELAATATRYAPRVPSGPDLGAVQLELRTREERPDGEPVPFEGWATEITDRSRAHGVSCALLDHSLQGVLIHAAELKRGVWCARGSRIAEDATVLPPVLVDAGARVLSRARIGPNVVLGRGVVVEREAVLSDLAVAPRVVIGEAARLRQAHVDGRASIDFVSGARSVHDDPLVVSSLVGTPTAPLSRTLALFTLALLLLPWLLAALIAYVSGRAAVERMPFQGRTLLRGRLGLAPLDLLPALVDVVLGRRDLLGVAQPQALEIESAREGLPLRVGALDITGRLAPGASTSTALLMWRWYTRNKRFALDRRLFGGQD